MANGKGKFNMDILTQLGALGGVIVVAGILFMAFANGAKLPTAVVPPGESVPIESMTDPFLYRSVSNAMYSKKGCGCGK